MQSWNILGLHFNSLNIIFLSFFKFPDFIPAKSSIIKSLKVPLIYLDSRSIVFDSILEVSLLSECKPSVVIEVCLPRLKIYSLTEALDSFIIVSLPIKTNTFVIVSEGIIGVDLYGTGIIFYGFIKFSNLVISESSVKESFEMVGHYFEGLRVKFYSLLIISLFSCCISLTMEHLCLLFLGRIIWHILHLLLLLAIDSWWSLRNAHGSSKASTICALMIYRAIGSTSMGTSISIW